MTVAEPRGHILKWFFFFLFIEFVYWQKWQDFCSFTKNHSGNMLYMFLPPRVMRSCPCSQLVVSA